MAKVGIVMGNRRALLKDGNTTLTFIEISF